MIDIFSFYDIYLRVMPYIQDSRKRRHPPGGWRLFCGLHPGSPKDAPTAACMGRGGGFTPHGPCGRPPLRVCPCWGMGCPITGWTWKRYAKEQCLRTSIRYARGMRTLTIFAVGIRDLPDATFPLSRVVYSV